MSVDPKAKQSAPANEELSLAVYGQLRGEMTSVLATYRQWILAQYAAIGGLLVAIISPDSQRSTDLYCAILIALVIIASNRVCSGLWLQALRMGSFIVVHFEMKALHDPACTWLLANRSEPYIPKPRQMHVPWIFSFMRHRYRPGFGLRDFYMHQFILLCALASAPAIILLGYLFDPADNWNWSELQWGVKVSVSALALLAGFIFLETSLGMAYATRFRDAQFVSWRKRKEKHEEYSTIYMNAVTQAEHVKAWAWGLRARRRLAAFIRRRARKAETRPDTNYIRETRATYQVLAPDYHLANTRERQTHKEKSMDRFMHHLGESRSPNVLVPGCGLGDDPMYLRSQGCSVLAFDFSSAMIAEARKMDPEGEYIELDIRRMGYLRHSFNGIWARACLYHLTEGEFAEFLKDARRKLKDDGLLYFSLKTGEGQRMEPHPNLRYESEDAKRKLKGTRFYTYYNREQIHKLAERSFDVIEVAEINGKDPALEFWCRKR